MEPWINITDSVTKIRSCLRFDQDENKDFNLKWCCSFNKKSIDTPPDTLLSV